MRISSITVVKVRSSLSAYPSHEQLIEYILVLFIMGEYQRAADDYRKSTELDGDFVFSHIQLAVAQYKLGDIAKSMATFRRTMRQFPQRSEPQNY